MIAYQRCDDFVAVKLPFGKAKRVNFYGFLPDPRTSVDELVDRLDESTFTRLSRSRTCPDCTVYLPRFGLEYDAVLNDSLIGLGMGPAFDPTSADFSAMTNQPVHVGQMNHKTMAAFDEQGGEAAAVSSLGLHLASAVHYTARFDRPFVVALYDEATDALLFVGAVNDPQ